MTERLFKLPELQMQTMFHVKHLPIFSSADDILVVAGGRAPQRDWLQQVAAGKKIYCADSGAKVCLAAGCDIQELFGDCDSTTKQVYEQAAKAGTIVHGFNPAKDDTDLQLLLKNLPDGDIIVTGVWGGRFDHLYSNVYTLLGFKKKRKCQVLLADEKEVMLLLAVGEEVKLKLQKEALALSLLPLTAVTSVDFSGVRWPLQQAQLQQLYPYAISNVAADKEIFCRCHMGAVGLYIRWQDR